jgi:hypothetical protein
MPDPKVETAIELAKRLGTYGKIDRSLQYEGRHYSSESLRKNDDIAFAKIRAVEKESLRFRHAMWLAIVTGLLSNAPLIVHWLTKIF